MLANKSCSLTKSFLKQPQSLSASLLQLSSSIPGKQYPLWLKSRAALLQRHSVWITVSTRTLACWQRSEQGVIYDLWRIFSRRCLNLTDWETTAGSVCRSDEVSEGLKSCSRCDQIKEEREEVRQPETESPPDAQDLNQLSLDSWSTSRRSDKLQDSYLFNFYGVALLPHMVCSQIPNTVPRINVIQVRFCKKKPQMR